MIKEINHTYTNEIVCPHCGYEYQDSWEMSDNDEEDCQECGEKFIFSREVDVHYNTQKLTPPSKPERS